MRGSTALDEPSNNGVFAVRKEERDSESRVRKEEERWCRSNQVAPAGSMSLEKVLPNGDVYHGEFFGTTPHGWGKYLWTDGCKYKGEWRKGEASGRGRFFWPSGATYDGDFKSGRMDGSGSFIGSDGDVYSGSWSADRKHGYGQKRYANGDVYEGWWRKNLQEGQGRYVWGNGNEYVGEWKNGVISGRGVLIWANGNRFDGQWEQGSPNGNGVFTWSDGSCYVGYWNSDATSQLMGTFYPPPGKGFSEHFSTTRKRSSFDGERTSSADPRIPSPRICLWKSDGEDGDITCDILNNAQASMFGSTHCSPRRNPNASRKTGQTISKGHKNYELMLNLQLGIRYSVGRCASLLRDLKSTDFDPKEKIWTRFPPAGSKKTPPHHSAEFRWKDYCPMVFRHLRDLFQVDPANYMLAVCGNDALRELRSPGKSGSCFYLTHDDRFMIKTVRKAEVKVMIRMLPSYYNHVRKYENSLVTKFYGVHCVKPNGGAKTRFIIMGNLFCSEYRIHRRFDLKGSSYGRAACKSECEMDETTTLKDLDLDFLFRLQKNWFQEFISQIDRDCEFLEGEGIMDYSLLVGLHFRGENTAEKFGLSPFLLRSGKSDSFQLEKFMRGCRFLEAELKERDRVMAGKKPLIRLGANMPARAERMARRSDSDRYGSGALFSRNGEVYEVILYFGIIDILQGYDISKKLERAYKSLQVDPSSISAVDPKLYSKRFRDFVRRIFVEDR